MDDNNNLPDIETHRILAKVVKMGTVEKHPNADRLAVGKVEGWQLVVPLETKEGDLGVYFEIDSVFPKDQDWVKLLQLKKTTIRTMRIRDVLSQGLFLPIGSLPIKNDGDIVGKDVTEELGITKRPDTLDEDAERNSKGNYIRYSSAFPSGPCRTDEPRIQSNTYMLKEMNSLPYYISLKYDGSSMTVGYSENRDLLLVCSRSVYLPEEENSSTPYWKAVKNYNLYEKLKRYPHLVFQGEVYGPNLHKNKLGVKDIRFAIFSIWNLKTQLRCAFDEFIHVCSDLDLPHVEILEEGNNFQYSIADLIQKAKGFYVETKNHREGIVVRPKQPKRTSRREQLSFKVINNDYLLQNDM
jgi:RNA ligase (TIGR02306 family)